MRQAIVFLIAVLAIINAVLAGPPLLPNGIYRIYTGNSHVPDSNRYFTGKADASTGSVVLLPNSKAQTDQRWRLRNHGKRVSLEFVGKRHTYLSLTRSGANPGAYVGVTTTRLKFGITKFAGGQFTRYVLSYPELVNNKTLVLGATTDNVDPKRIAFQNKKDPVDASQAWKFARVSLG
ncbi:hypothetical protein BGZ76_003967 [Entomortierella beljakovae]|nr:hypothetical protein BGZ76_003967 [Entomortierella beljakovae]